MTKAQRQLLEKICEDYDIVLEKLPKPLTQKESNALFIEYDQLKQALVNTNNPEKLQERIIEVRNQLVMGHLEPMYKMISKYLKNIENKYDREDIYQDCCEVLMTLIEEYNPYMGANFIQYMYYLKYRNFWGKIKISKDTLNTNNNLNKLLIAKQRYEQKFETAPTALALKNIAGLNRTTQAETLLKLEQALEHTVSLEELYDSILEIQTEESSRPERNITPELFDDTLEDRASAIWLREILLRMIDTLPRLQKEVIMLRYGFTTGIPLTHEQIGKKLNISSQMVGTTCKKAEAKLKSSPNIKYLEQAVEGYTTAVYKDRKQASEQIETKSAMQLKKQRRKLESYLLSKLNKEELAMVIEETIPKKEWPAFLNLYFGINGEKQCSKQTILERLQMDDPTYQKLRREALDRLISILEKRCSQSEKPLSEEELIDYLMTNYLNHPKKRILKK